MGQSGRREQRGGNDGSGGWKVILLVWIVLTLAVNASWRVIQGWNPPGEEKEKVPFWLPGARVELPDYVEQDLIPVNPYSRPGRYLKTINGVVIHYVGNPGSSARGNRDYFASLADGVKNTYASSHFVVGLRGEVIQCVPLTEVAYASNQRNGDTVSIEVCHPDEGGRFSDVTYARVIELTAWLCDTFDIDPAEGVIRHYDVTEKICPKYYVEHPKAWEQLKIHVAEKLDAMRKEKARTEADS